MKMMKKALVCLLATLMLLTVVPFAGIVAFAEDLGTQTIQANAPLTITVDPDEYTYLMFTPTKSAVYRIYSQGDADVKCYVYEDETGYQVDSNDDGGENYNFLIYTQLEIGKDYVLEISSYEDYAANTTICVAESDVVSVSFNNIKLIHNGSTYWEEDYIDDEWVEWKKQAYESYIGYTITFADGSTMTDEEKTFEMQVEDDQTYTNQWKAGGTYTVTVTMLGFTNTFTVTMLANPILSVTATPVTIIENTAGGWEVDEYWDDELGWCDTPEYYHYGYSAYRTPKVEIVTTGATYYLDPREDGFEWEGISYEIELWSEQSYDDQWTVGKNKVYGEVAGTEFQYDATVIESPIKSVVANPVKLCEKGYGYWDTDEYYDDVKEEWVNSSEYFRYYTPWASLTVTLKDGTVFTVDENNIRYEWSGLMLEMECWSE